MPFRARRGLYPSPLPHHTPLPHPAAADAHAGLAFQNFLRDRGQDAFAEIAAAVVHIEAGDGQDYPAAVVLLVRTAPGDHIPDIGDRLLVRQFFYPPQQFFRELRFGIPPLIPF